MRLAATPKSRTNRKVNRHALKMKTAFNAIPMQNQINIGVVHDDSSQTVQLNISCVCLVDECRKL